MSLLLLALLAAACGGPRYAEYARIVGASELLGWGVLREGDTVTLRLVDRATGRGRPGLQVRFTSPRAHEPLISNQDGDVAFPISNALLAANPRLGVEHGSEVYLRFMTHLRCEALEGVPDDAKKLRAIERTEYEAWPKRERGADALYAEPGVPLPVLERTAGDLVTLRVVMRDMTGVEPPPIAVGLVGSDATARFSPDAAHRPVLTLRMDATDGLLGGAFVHAWTHALVRQIVLAPEERTRFMEEGLADFVAFVARDRMHRTSPMAALTEHRRVLADLKQAAPRKAADALDLTRLPAAFDARQGPDLAHALYAQCSKDAALGGALGFALAYERGARDDTWVMRTIAELHRVPDTGGWVDAFGMRKFHVLTTDKVSIDGALHVIGEPQP